MTIVGDHDPTLLKYFDCTRSGPRSAFDSNVVFQFEIMEYVSLLMILWAPNSYLSCLLTRYLKVYILVTGSTSSDSHLIRKIIFYMYSCFFVQNRLLVYTCLQ